MIKYLYPFLTTTVCLLPAIAHAQTYQPSNRTPVADSTQIGTQVSGSGNNFNITGGLNKGQTLFHSFTDFSVPTKGQANFSNPVGNRDIITRVTGNVFSDINGLVNTNGANFFLINPNGIVFGTNARLNVGKAFVGSTANSIDLVDAGGRTINFGTNASGDAPLLSVAPNVLFDVSRLNVGGGTGAISNFGTLETNNPNQYIGLIGGNVKLDGGKINALGGRVELGGLSAPGTVTFGDRGTVQLPANAVRGDVSLINGSGVIVAGVGGGDIAITARNLDILGESFVLGGIFPGFGTPEIVAGDIEINATERIVVGSNSEIRNDVPLNSKGNGGDIKIEAGSLSLQDGARITATTEGKGNAGNVKVVATGAVSLVGTDTGIFSSIFQGGVGQGGNIEFFASSLSLQDGAQITAATLGQGNAGNVKVMVTGAVSLVGTDTGIFSSIFQGGVGQGGNIEFFASSLSLQDGAQITAATLGQGNAGNVKVTVTGDVSLVGANTGILSAIESGGLGNGGNIEFTASSLSLQDGAQVTSGTYSSSISVPGRGNAGDIKVRVIGDVNIAGEGKTNLGFERQSGIFAANFGEGKAGNLDIVSVGNISLIQRGEISVNAVGQLGSAGNILLASKKLNLNQGSILAFGENGQDGSIDIKNTDLLLMRNNSLISTSSGNSTLGGRGGNIVISAPFIIALPKNNDIRANAYSTFHQYEIQY